MNPSPSLLTGRDFESATFTDLVAPELERSGLVFYDCTFDNCDLAEAKLTDCRFVTCTFVRCDLRLVTLTGSTFREASFEDCKLIGVAWSVLRSDPGLPPEIDFFRCALDFGDFSNLDLSRRRLQGCRLHDANFARTRLIGADLRDSDLDNAHFEGCDLGKADLRGARNYRLDPRSNRVAGARFSLPDVLGLLAYFEIEID